MTMERLSLKNLFLPVSHRQFVHYTAQFKGLAEKAFQSRCTVIMEALSKPKVYTTFADDEIENELAKINKKNVICLTESWDGISKEIWDKASYVSLCIRPVTEKPAYAFGHAEFKGEKPKQATFYIQGTSGNTLSELISSNPRKLIGSGYISNGIRSVAVPSSLLRGNRKIRFF